MGKKMKGMGNRGMGLLEERKMTPVERENLLKHISCAVKLSLDKVTRAWRDKDKVLCVEYSDGSWYHYTETGEWY